MSSIGWLVVVATMATLALSTIAEVDVFEDSFVMNVTVDDNLYLNSTNTTIVDKDGNIKYEESWDGRATRYTYNETIDVSDWDDGNYTQTTWGRDASGNVYGSYVSFFVTKSCNVTTNRTWKSYTNCSILDISNNSVLTLEAMTLTVVEKIIIESGSKLAKDAGSNVSVGG